MNDHYWTLDTSLFNGQFRYFGKELVQVRGKVHTEQERYRKSDINQEITPIAIPQGERTYLHMKPFVLIPDVILTVGLYPAPRSGGEIGEVVGAQERKMKEVEIGNMQAWAYPDNTLVLWGIVATSPNRWNSASQGRKSSSISKMKASCPLI